MARTTIELDKVMKDFENKIVQCFISKTPLGVMMTREDKLEHAKLIQEYYEAMKAEEKLKS